MKMTSWGRCVSVYDSSGEAVVHPDEPGISRIGVSGSELEVDGSTSEEEVENKKKRSVRCLLVAVFEG